MTATEPQSQQSEKNCCFAMECWTVVPLSDVHRRVIKGSVAHRQNIEFECNMVHIWCYSV